MSIWDKEDGTILILNPNNNNIDQNNGTFFKPTAGYDLFLQILNGR